MKIIFDGKQVTGSDKAKNLVEFLDESGIKITAPCYRNKKEKGIVGCSGCCRACVIEVNGAKSYACATKPKEDMNVIYNRDDLLEERTQKLNEYAEQNNSSACNLQTSQCNCNCS